MISLQKILFRSSFLFLFALASCGTDRYNTGETLKTKDYRAGDEYVYGDGAGKPARQTKNVYGDTPAGQARADALRNKLFGESTAVLAESSTMPADSSQTEALATDTTKTN